MQSQCFKVGQVAERYGVTAQTIWNWMRQGRFPQPLRISRKCSRWTAEMLEEFDANRDAWQPKKERKRSYGGNRLMDYECEVLHFCPVAAGTVRPLVSGLSCRMCRGPMNFEWMVVNIDDDSDEGDIQWDTIPGWSDYNDLVYCLQIIDERYGVSCGIEHFADIQEWFCSESCKAAKMARDNGFVSRAREVGICAGLPNHRTLSKHPEEWRAVLVASRFLDFRARLEESGYHISIREKCNQGLKRIYREFP